ncbi:MAG: hypothetical protein K2M17_03205 [Bacilli bacterium]|nr:hypothetical protein [Bacilli bacterium]
MRFIEYNAFKSKEKNASSKAKVDVSSILHRLGFKDLYKPSQYRIVRIIQQFWNIIFLPKDIVLVIQYQSHIPFFYRLLSLKRKITKIAILHDVESLRGKLPKEKEIKILNGFDLIIDHNPAMREYLVSNGLKSPIQDIGIFDYLLNSSIRVNTQFDRYSIFFAGNLYKSKFLSKLGSLQDLNFNIYGSSFDGIKNIIDQPNVYYKGAFLPDDLISNIEGGWGLVWDGDDLATCSGATGEYLKYNNPHKVSMCIVSERPLIIWSQSAMAKYILSKGIGICVNNLYELSDIIRKITDCEYKEMVEKVKIEKQRLINGQNLKECLEKWI